MRGARTGAARHFPGEIMPAKKARSASPGARAPKKAARAVRPAAKPAAKPAARPRSATEVPSAIGLWLHHIDYTSHDLPGIKRFYTQILGFARVVEEPKAGYLTIFTTPTTSLGFMAPMPGPPEQWRPP